MTTKQRQNLLQYLGFYEGAVDGIYGTLTKQAVERFQAAYGIGVDGVAGTETEAALLDAVANGIVKQQVHSADTSCAAQYLQSDGCYHIPRGVDVQLTKNFWAHEIHCQGVGCCTESVISKRIMDLSQEIRDDIGESLEISTAGGSGYRCRKRNLEVGGADGSLHKISEAVDLHYRDPAALKAAVLRRLKDGEVGLYGWGCHVGMWDRGYISQFNG